MNVWMADLRYGLKYHHSRPEGRFTVCGMTLKRMHELPRISAIDLYAARGCKACSGDAPIPPPPRVA